MTVSMFRRAGSKAASRLSSRTAPSSGGSSAAAVGAARMTMTAPRPSPAASSLLSLSWFSTAPSSRAQQGHTPWDNLRRTIKPLPPPATTTASEPSFENHEGILHNGGGPGIPILEHASSLLTSFESLSTAPSMMGAESAVIEDRPRTSVLMELTDRVGVLHDVLRYFWKFDVNVCRIESRPAKTTASAEQPRRFDFFVDFEGSLDDSNVQELMSSLHSMTSKLLVLDEKQVHWFPRHISELDHVANRTLEAGTDLESDHPGFNDPTYRSRRSKLAEAAMQHRWDRPIPRIDYTPEEVEVWTAVWDQMQELWSKHACKEYLASLQLMKEHCQYRRDNIPQQADINDYLMRRTGVRLRPVAGLLSSRDFLNGLAFRVFFCTQYIRHWSRPLYTPEPDICHELMGHVPMFADHDFADFSQEIGLASLGASDEDVDKLARCYWHSVEFGLCLENGVPKAYGAGLLSSFGELEYACSPDHPGAEKPPSVVPWDPAVAAKTAFPITTYQPTYFCADSLQSAKDQMRDYCQELPRPFYATWNPQTCSIHIDRPVKRTKGTAPPTTADQKASESSA